MKTEYKVEGDKLIFSISEEKSIDTDADGESSIKFKGGFEVEADGSEVLEELLKSSTLAQKAKDLLGKAGIKV